MIQYNSNDDVSDYRCLLWLCGQVGFGESCKMLASCADIEVHEVGRKSLLCYYCNKLLLMWLLMVRAVGQGWAFLRSGHCPCVPARSSPLIYASIPHLRRE